MTSIPGSDPNAHLWRIGLHLSALSGYIGVPVGFVLGPLLVWLLRKDSDAIIDDQGKDALNWNITIFVAFLLCLPLAWLLIGIPLLIALCVVHIVTTVMATIAISQDRLYRYPFSIRFVN